MTKSEKILQLRNEYKKFIDRKKDAFWQITIPDCDKKNFFKDYSEKIKMEFPLLYWSLICFDNLKPLLEENILYTIETTIIIDPLMSRISKHYIYLENIVKRDEAHKKNTFIYRISRYCEL